MNKKALLEREGVGALLRIFENTSSQVSERLAMAEKTYQALCSISAEGQPVFKKIVFLVWADPKFVGSDCGETASALRKKFQGNKVVDIVEVEQGGIFCDSLNKGINHLFRYCRCSYAMTLSLEAVSYCNTETVNDMLDALCAGAQVAPVAIDEVRQFVIEGCACNTFNIWHIESLLMVGGFDPMCERSTDPDHADWKRGFDAESGEYVWHLKEGAEEIPTLIKMLKRNQEIPFIAPIIPRNANGKFQAPADPNMTKDMRSRFITKRARQVSWAEAMHVDIFFLKGGVMPGYRNW